MIENEVIRDKVGGDLRSGQDEGNKEEMVRTCEEKVQGCASE